MVCRLFSVLSEDVRQVNEKKVRPLDSVVSCVLSQIDTYLRHTAYGGSLDQGLTNPAGDAQLFCFSHRAHAIGVASDAVAFANRVGVDSGDVLGPIQDAEGRGRDEVPHIFG